MQLVQRVLIVGGGTAGWLTAVHLKTALGPRAEVTLIESPDVPTIGVGEGTQPTLRRHFADLKISEFACLKACAGSFKNGIRFEGWRNGRDCYLHPFFSGPAEDRNNPFSGIHAWVAQRLRVADPTESLADACFLEAQLLRERKAPIAVREGRVVEQPVANYAWHLDAVRLALFLREVAAQRGVRHVADHVRHVERTAPDQVAAVWGETTGRHAADLFVDCTGFHRLLIGTTEDPFVDFSTYLLNDRAVTARLPYPQSGLSAVESCTTSTALRHGWAWQVPLAERLGAGYVYASRFVSDDDAELEFRRFLTAHGLPGQTATVQRLAFRTGYYRRPWTGNAVAIGLAGGFIEPLEATGIALVTHALYRLIEHWPSLPLTDEGANAFRRDAFNRDLEASYLWIRDFIVLHYCLSERRDSAYWLAATSPEATPESLRETLRHWSHNWPFGEAARSPLGYALPPASVACILAGFERYPALPNAYVGALGDAELAALLAEPRARRTAVAQLCPDHLQFLQALAQSA